MIRTVLALCAVFLVSTPALAADVEGTLRTIKERGAIRLGFRENSPPFSSLGPDGRPAGYSVDLCLRVAQAVEQELGIQGLRVEFVPVTPDNRIDMVAGGSVDLECGSTTSTLSRQQRVDFSLMTFVDGGGLLVRRASRIRSLADLAGRRVAVATGTTTERALDEALKRQFVAATVVKVKDHDAGLAAVEDGTAEAYASDRVLLVGLILRAKDMTALALADEQFSYEPYGLMLRRNDAAFRLVVNRTLARIYRTGQFADLTAKWFGEFGKPTGILLAMYLMNALPE